MKHEMIPDALADGPQPVAHIPPFLGALGRTFVVTGSAAIAVTLMSVASRPTPGAPRSAQLEWQRREAELERAIAEQATGTVLSATTRGIRRTAVSKARLRNPHSAAALWPLSGRSPAPGC